jgi:hypothetical protein
MPRGIVLVWLVATLLAVMVAAWREEWRSTDAMLRAMLLGALIDGRMVEYPPMLVTTIEALEDIDRPRRGVLVAGGARRVDSIQRPRVRTARRTARGPPRDVVDEVHERESPDRKEKTC